MYFKKESSFIFHKDYTLYRIKDYRENEFKNKNINDKLLLEEIDIADSLLTFFNNKENKIGVVITNSMETSNFISIISPYILSVNKVLIITNTTITSKKIKNDLYGSVKQPLLLRKSFINSKNLSGYMPSCSIVDNVEEYFGKNIVVNFDLGLVKNDSDNISNIHFFDPDDIDLIIIYRAEKQSIISIEKIINHFDKSKVIIITTNRYFKNKLKENYKFIYQFENKD